MGVFFPYIFFGNMSVNNNSNNNKNYSSIYMPEAYFYYCSHNIVNNIIDLFYKDCKKGSKNSSFPYVKWEGVLVCADCCKIELKMENYYEEPYRLICRCNESLLSEYSDYLVLGKKVTINCKLLSLKNNIILADTLPINSPACDNRFTFDDYSERYGLRPQTSSEFSFDKIFKNKKFVFLFDFDLNVIKLKYSDYYVLRVNFQFNKKEGIKLTVSFFHLNLFQLSFN